MAARCWCETFAEKSIWTVPYVTLNHSSRGAEPAQTVLVFGRKGEVEGDFRTDETEMLVLRPDGTIQRTEQTVKTWLKYDAIAMACAIGIAMECNPD